MKIPLRYFQNSNVRFVFQDENGNELTKVENLILDGLCIHHDQNDEETYSFRPVDSGAFSFWCNSLHILAIN
jgi:hypothetical protein